MLLSFPRERDTRGLLERIYSELILAGVCPGMDRNMDFLRHGMARIHYIVRTPPGTELTQSAAQIEQSLLAATQSWRDQLRDAYTSKHRGDTVLAARFFDAFPRSYQDLSSADEAAVDLHFLLRLSAARPVLPRLIVEGEDRKSTRLNSSH